MNVEGRDSTNHRTERFPTKKKGSKLKSVHKRLLRNQSHKKVSKMM